MPRLANKHNCTGCAACSNACQHKAITMRPDKEGFLSPCIDENLCVQCNLCEMSCPIVTTSSCNNVSTPKAYAVWSELDRTCSSSGGAFSAFARLILQKGGVVYGATLQEGSCFHVGITCEKELSLLRGSKYAQSAIGDVFQHIKSNLKDNRYVLFCGTPCQVAGLKAYLRKDYEQLLTLDLVCHGVPSNKVLSSYMEKLKMFDGRFKSLADIRFRMLNGWGLNPSASMSTGENVELCGVSNLYMEAFTKSALFRKSCYNCCFSTLPRVGDCSLADFWGIGRHGISFNQKVDKGVSLVLVNNEKGSSFLQELSNCFVEERTLEEALIENHNITKPSTLHPQRDEIVSAFLDSHKTLEQIESEFHLVDKSVKAVLKNFAIKWGIITFAKSLYNKIKAS